MAEANVKTYSKDAFNMGVLLAFVLGGLVGYFLAFFFVG